ncbi:MAG: pyridoxamine 5'-phosphate oxidase family protein [Pandoraea sp.]|uniref:pyridoxamine 5'-phosphate oxidase family protein n=1 Tax=Pandoraea sp. TaxID=1883445 RepID=UPI0011F97FFF|nr:pyridoxamine 5'-phosphate oxidase family protein [Pandoraea sp.]TAM18716.1 MAG: pyridoxamine 5'-phosphate oxidase family protein [Pandoraea sp.]
MAIINQDMREVMARAMLSYVATICADGSPNLSPKGSVMVYDDDHLIFMNQNSPDTFANLRRDQRVEINAVDIFRRRGYRFKGRARILPPGDPAFEWLKQKLIALNGPQYPAHEAALIDIEQALPVLSPVYQWGHAAEDDLAARYAASYVKAAGLTPGDLAADQ